MKNDEREPVIGTRYMKHPVEDYVGMLIPKTDYTIIKQLDGEEYSVKDSSNIATDLRIVGEKITKEEYQNFGN